MTPEELNEKLEHLYASAEAASSEGLTDEAIRRCEAALQLLEMNYDEELKFSPSDFLMLAGDACWEDSDAEGAFRYYRQIHEMDPGRLDALIAVGVALFHLCRFHSAQHYLELASVEDPDVAEVWYYLGMCALRAGQRAVAEVYLERAHEKEPERWPRPKLLDVEEIQRILEEVVATIPEPLQKAIENLPILVEEFPPDDLLHASDPPADPLMLGIFEGTPLPEQSSMDAPQHVTQIRIFSTNIGLIARNRERLMEELEITLKHELGHYLGLDEDDLAERGLD